jgi:imidazolonepropionase-like amidohydrolase
MKGSLLAAVVLLPALAFAKNAAIVGGTLAIGDGSQPITNGTVIFREGRIVAAGANVPVPADATVIDAHGKWVAAGMVAGFTELGIGSYSRLTLNDASAPRSPFSAAVDVASAINPQDAPIQVDRAVGITRAIVVPSASKSIFAGQGAIIDLGTGTDAITRPRTFQYVELGETGGRIAGGSRPAAYAFFREAMAETRDFMRTPSAKTDERSGEVLMRPDVAALVPVLEGKQLLLIHVERASDILQVLALKREYPDLRIILAGASEGWRVATEIAAAHVPVISEAIEDNPSTFESLAATESNVGRMTHAGVSVAISTIDGEPLETYLRQLAASLVAITKVPGATGLDWGQAFATITSKPAEIMGVGNEIGSLRAGRRADVVIWDGDPLEATSAPVAVFIDGVPQPLDNHLTKVRDRYRDPEAGPLPKAYVR